MNFLLFCFSSEPDIDECSDGFVQCDSRANCINLPGWYHCECRDGYHDNGMFSPSGESCEGQCLRRVGCYDLHYGGVRCLLLLWTNVVIGTVSMTVKP